MPRQILYQFIFHFILKFKLTIKIYLKIYVADHSLSIHLSFLSTIPWQFPICFVFMENRCIGDFYHIFDYLCHWKCRWSDSFSQIPEMKSSKHLKKHCSWSGKLTLSIRIIIDRQMYRSVFLSFFWGLMPFLGLNHLGWIGSDGRVHGCKTKIHNFI